MVLSESAKRAATYADLEAVPPHLVAEIIHGDLVTHPRPAPRHGMAANALSASLTPSHQFGAGGPGGWVFIPEPELHLGKHVLVPDIAGWRRERMPEIPDTAFVDLPPDWLSEVLSASTERYDRKAKRDIYGEFGVSYLWFVDPRIRVLQAYQLVAGNWLWLADFTGDDQVRVAPFDDTAFSLAQLWSIGPPGGTIET